MSDWQMSRPRRVATYPIFEVRQHDATNPRNGRTGTYTTLHAPDWVQVVAVTPGDHVVLVRQFRHGAGERTLEVPGGVVDPGEDPLEAAARELREETGYAASTWRPLGSLMPNPAFLDNRLHTFLALDATIVAPIEPDDGEDIDIVTAPVGHLPKMIARGDIRHALVVASLGLLRDLAGGWHRPR